jgi:ABC-type antimicrobial peptide transport system permease subunit
MTKVLFGVSGHDSLVFVGVPAFVIVASLLAVWLPASTIANIDPIRSLRSE